MNQEIQPNKYYVYALYDCLNVPFYIGKGSGNRGYGHVGEARRGSPLPVHKKIRSMNYDPTVKILMDKLYESEAYELEELTILTVGRRLDGSGPLLNLSSGGRGGTSGCTIKLTPEQERRKNKALRTAQVREKISLGVKHCKRELSEKGRQVIRDTHKGKVLSFETRAKISASKKGKKGHPHTKESKAKIAESNRKRTVSEETKRKISESVKRVGMTKEQKTKQKEAILRQVTCPHCDKKGARSIMIRWHFDNCRLRKKHES